MRLAPPLLKMKRQNAAGEGGELGLKSLRAPDALIITTHTRLLAALARAARSRCRLLLPEMALALRRVHSPWADDASAAGALTAELAARDAELAAARGALTRLQHDFRYNLGLLEARDAELASYDAAFADAAAAAAVADEALLAARAALAEEVAAAAQSCERAAAAEARAEAADATRQADVAAAAATHARLNDMLRAQQRRFETELAEQRRSNDASAADARRRLETAERRIEAVQDALAAAASRAEALEASVRVAEGAHADVQRALSDSATELAAARARADGAFKRVAAAERDAAAAREAVATLRAELDARASAASAAVAAARNEAHSLALLLAARDAELAASREREFDLHQATRAAGAVAVVDTAAHAALLESLTADNVHLREKLDAAVAANTRLRSGVALMRAEMEAAAAAPTARGEAELEGALNRQSHEDELTRLAQEREELMDISSSLRSALRHALALGEQTAGVQSFVSALKPPARHGIAASSGLDVGPSRLEAALACGPAPASARPPSLPASERATPSQAAARERAAAASLRRAAETQPRAPPVRNWAAEATGRAASD